MRFLGGERGTDHQWRRVKADDSPVLPRVRFGAGALQRHEQLRDEPSSVLAGLIRL